MFKYYKNQKSQIKVHSHTPVTSTIIMCIITPVYYISNDQLNITTFSAVKKVTLFQSLDPLVDTYYIRTQA